jgi:hypothetical protein
VSFTEPADVQKQLEEAFGGEPEPLNPIEEVPSDPTPEEPPAPVEPEPTPEPEIPAAGELVTLPNGSQVTLERLQQLAQIDQAFQTDPEIARAITEVVSQRAPRLTPSPAREPQVEIPADLPPPELDLEDPTVKALWSALQSTKAEVQEWKRSQSQAQAQMAYQAIASGKDEFAKKHNISPDELAVIDMRAAQMIDLNRLAQSRGGDFKSATVEALELAALADPNYRTKFIAPAPDDTKRKQNLNALAGGSGATPRSEPDPSTMTPEQRKQAMITELANSLKGQNS